MAWEWARVKCAKFPADTVRMHVWLGRGWPSSIKRKTGTWPRILQQQAPDRNYCGKKNLQSGEWRMPGVLGGSGFIETFPSPISICLEFWLKNDSSCCEQITEHLSEHLMSWRSVISWRAELKSLMTKTAFCNSSCWTYQRTFQLPLSFYPSS